jgi:hypothetical protein
MKHPGSLRISARWSLCVVPLLPLLAPRQAAAEPAPRAEGKSVTVTTNVLSPFFGAWYLAANVRASKSVGVLFNASYFSVENDHWKTHTGTLGAGLSYYFQGEALRRWYVEGFSELMLSRWRHEPSGNTAAPVAGFTVGSVVGHRWVWELGPVLDLAAGAVMLHFPSARVETDAGTLSSKAFTRLYPAVKVDVGWAF